SIQQLLGHLIDSAANNHQRFVRAQHANPLVFPKYEQDDWVNVQRYEELPWSDVVDLWFSYNRHLAHVMRRIPARAREVECRIGPYEPVSLAYIVLDYNTHLRHHLAQIDAIEKGMAVLA
ncbi:MAG TPA: DinB family protein, partial [Rhodothermales bacterium]